MSSQRLTVASIVAEKSLHNVNLRSLICCGWTIREYDHSKGPTEHVIADNEFIQCAQLCQFTYSRISPKCITIIYIHKLRIVRFVKITYDIPHKQGIAEMKRENVTSISGNIRITFSWIEDRNYLSVRFDAIYPRVSLKLLFRKESVQTKHCALTYLLDLTLKKKTFPLHCIIFITIKPFAIKLPGRTSRCS